MTITSLTVDAVEPGASGRLTCLAVSAAIPHDEGVTTRLMPKINDVLRKAATTGQPHEKRFDSPPADPGAADPPRTFARAAGAVGA